MATVIDVTEVLGTDGYAPIQNPDGLNRYLNKEQLYVGGPGLKMHVGMVNDRVWDPVNKTDELIVEVDDQLIPKLIPWNPVRTEEEEVDGQQSLIGFGSGCAQTVRLLYNSTVTPFQCVIDQRYIFGGLHARYARVYRGRPGLDTPEVISAIYDATGNFVTNNIPLEIAELEDTTNVSQKYVRPFHTTAQLKQGETVTVVIYGEEGQPVADRKLTVQETGWLLGDAQNAKLVTGISLKSWLIDPQEPNVIEIPLNLTVNSINAMGIVHYSDGTKKELPALGGRFSIMGMTDLVATIPDTLTEVTAQYLLAPGEYTENANTYNEKTITADYFIRMGPANNAYSVRLWCYPTWVDAVNGYRLEWFLGTLERKQILNVTQFIVYNLDTNPGFDPRGYGLRQTISVSLDLSRISSAYHAHIHVQAVSIELLRQGTETGTLWRWSDYGSTDLYGVEVGAQYIQVNANLKRLKVNSGAVDQADWLKRLYYNTHPLRDSGSEGNAPEPNYFIIEIPGQTMTLESRVDAWNGEFQTSAVLTPNSTIYVKFVLRTNDGDQVLSIAGMPLKQVSSFDL